MCFSVCATEGISNAENILDLRLPPIFSERALVWIPLAESAEWIRNRGHKGKKREEQKKRGGKENHEMHLAPWNRRAWQQPNRIYALA